METVLILIIVLAVLAYYGVLKSIETGANIANREIELLDTQHRVSVHERTAKLSKRVSEETIMESMKLQSLISSLDSLETKSE